MPPEGNGFGFSTPPAEWTEGYQKTNLALVANATLSALAEPTQQQREHAAMAATILHLGARLEALEKAAAATSEPER